MSVTYNAVVAVSSILVCCMLLHTHCAVVVCLLIMYYEDCNNISTAKNSILSHNYCSVRTVAVRTVLTATAA